MYGRLIGAATIMSGEEVAPTAVIAQAPARSGAGDPIGAFLRAEPDCSQRIALGATQDVGHGELRPAEHVQHRIDRNGVTSLHGALRLPPLARRTA